MNFLDYIKGQKKGIDANRIEKDSMQDPFMYEAIEGFDSVQDDHIERINYIHKKLNTKHIKENRKHYRMWQISVACAVAIVIFIAGGYFYTTNHRPNLYAENTKGASNDNDIIKIYVPENYYSENVTVIAKHNVDAVKAYQVEMGKLDSKKSKSNDANITEKNKEKKEVLNIYIPE